jgi:hypothetical protein
MSDKIVVKVAFLNFFASPPAKIVPLARKYDNAMT